jgi:serine/threonine protein kinase
MGEVYRARDLRLKREVAIKTLPRSFAGDRDRAARFEREARAASALNHPNIAVVYDVGAEDEISFIVSELVRGETLARIIEHGALPLRKLIEVGAQTADGLAAAHTAGIVHRDLKPGNVMLTAEGRVKILDFGLARQEHAPEVGSTTLEISHPGVIVGTPGYMSPEQVRGEPADSRSDIFSLGVMLHETASGKRPFLGDTSVEVMNSILKDDPPDLPSTFPPTLDRVVRRCLEKEPSRRFQSAADLAFALNSISAAPPAAPGPYTRRKWLMRTSNGLRANGYSALLSPSENWSLSRFKWSVILACVGCVLTAAVLTWLGWPLAKTKILRSIHITKDGRRESLLTAKLDKREPTTSPVSSSASAGSTVQPLVEVASPSVRILCGQRRPHTDRLGRLWTADHFFDGGDYWERPGQIPARTFDPSLFQDARVGNFSYHIPLSPGVYELHLYFAEPNVGSPTGVTENGRVFQVGMNGKPLLRDFDVVSDAGGAGIVDERVFKDVSPAADGILHISFVSVRSQAMVSAIVVEPAKAHRLNTVRILVHESPYRDSHKLTWMPDNFWLGGSVGVPVISDTVEGTPDRALYSKHRYGNFSYAIPVDEGEYALTLHFAESYWGRENEGGGGTGSRVFDVFCNGEALARKLVPLRKV